MDPMSQDFTHDKQDLKPMEFAEKIHQAVQSAIVDFLRKGDWMRLDYNAELKVDTAWLREMHDHVDMNRVMEIVQSRVEERIADGIINAMMTEISSDVKSIMSNRELREDLRSTLRAKIREVQSAISNNQ
jgi:hypothetical protein